jgi:hypothetical protein
MKITPLVWSIWTAHSSKQIFFLKLASKQFLACTTQSTQAETPTAHKTAHYGPKEPMPRPRDPSQPIIQHRPTLPSIHGPSAHTTKGPARVPRPKDSHGLASRARSLRAYHSPPRPSPFALALAHPIPLAFPHLLAVAALASLGFRPPPAMSKQGAFVSSFPLFPLSRSGGIPLVFRADWLVFFVLEGSDATAGSGVGFCFAGGKAKPLKAPKADKKEYDEVCCYALDLVPVSLLD